MTTVISRLYADQSTADGVMAQLKEARFPDSLIAHFDSKAKADAFEAARLTADDAAAYKKKMKAGNILVIVTTYITPFGAAERAMKIMDGADTIDAGAADPNLYIKEEPEKFEAYPTILKDHPRFLSQDIGPDHPREREMMSVVLGLKLLSEHRTKKSISENHGRASTKLLPWKLLSDRKPKDNVISGGRRFLYNPKKLA